MEIHFLFICEGVTWMQWWFLHRLIIIGCFNRKKSFQFSNALSNILWRYEGVEIFRFFCSVSALSIIHSPSTISCESASVKPCSFFSLILISPVSFLWHLLRSNRLWLADFSILVLLSSWSSSPSLNHWIFMGLCPRKCNLKMALCPTLTVFGSVKALRSSRSTLGGSKDVFRSWRSIMLSVIYFNISLLVCLYIFHLQFAKCHALMSSSQTFDINHCLCFTAICLKTVFSRVLFRALAYDQFMNRPIFSYWEIFIWEYLIGKRANS